MAVDAEIHRLSDRRQAVWFGSLGETAEVARIAVRLADLYERKRFERAQAETGTRRAEIVRRARVESELERLMSERVR